MKKFLLSALGVAMALGASATNYVVYSGDDLTSDEVSMSPAWYWWWNCTFEERTDADSPEGKAMYWGPTENPGANFCGGYFITDDNLDMLHNVANCDLVFQAKITGTIGSLILRLTDGADRNYELASIIPQDGQYHEVRINLEEAFEGLPAVWASATVGQYVFALVGDQFDTEAGVYTANIHYEETVEMPKISVVAQNITMTSADLAWTTTIPEGMTNAVVTMDGEVITANPVQLTGLTASTSYSHVFTVSADKDGETYTSNVVTCTFRTERDATQDVVYSDYVKAKFNNAYLVGEDASLARTMAMSLPFDITYAVDGTLTYSIDLTQCKDVVGLVPQIWSNGFLTLEAGENNVYSVSLGEQTEGAEIAISHYLAYAGGSVDIRSAYVTVGQEQARPTIGEAAALELTAANTVVKVGQSNVLTLIATDAAGYYIPATSGTLVPSGDGISIINSVAVASEKGRYDVTASFGDLTAAVTIICPISESSYNLVAGLEGVTDGENAANATDENEGTYLFWDCSDDSADYQEHTLQFTLDDTYYIEAVECYWEGASSTDYCVAIYPQNPIGGWEPLSISHEDWDGTRYFDVIGEGGGAGNNQRHILYDEDGLTAIPGSFISLDTQKAYDKGWGMKLFQIRVYGQKDDPSGVKNVSVDTQDTNAPVEYYNLQGIRVNEPQAGQIVIRRQGNTATKILVK
ncbi:MAG: hypothetical protein LIP02_04810 [Bacteroidales bacterium]|nr:hypothetical protein [Bacteroidales bacterium]